MGDFDRYFKIREVTDKIREAFETSRKTYEVDKPFVIFIDGNCGAGKSTFADMLMLMFGASVVRADHFFLQPGQRTFQRLAEAGGNIDYERFNFEIVPCLENRRHFVYGRFDCSLMKIFYDANAGGTDIIVVEGSYCMNPKIKAEPDIRIFMETDSVTQLERIVGRSGADKADMFVQKWIPLERMYFDVFNIKEKCDYVIRT